MTDKELRDMNRYQAEYTANKMVAAGKQFGYQSDHPALQDRRGPDGMHQLKYNIYSRLLELESRTSNPLAKPFPMRDYGTHKF